MAYAAWKADYDRQWKDDCVALDGVEANRDLYLYSPMSQLFMVVFGTFVLFMQGGFAMLEAGSTGSTATTSILFKNMIDSLTCIAAWFVVGYAFAFGKGNSFIGEEGFALHDVSTCNYAHMYFQYTFAATCATIVSGAMAGRTKLVAYLVYSTFICSWVYPVCVHWVWGPDPWLVNEGFRDFAGAGVVHVTGGTAAIVGAYFVGPRGTSNFEREKDKHKIPGSSTSFVALGTIILVFGFVGFNGGSVQTVDTAAETGTVSRAVINTILAASTGGLTSELYSRKFALRQYWSLTQLCNGVIAGMVSVCAGADIYRPWTALLIGAIGGLVYKAMSKVVQKFKIDDPLDAGAVHLGGGIWGVIACSLLAGDDSVIVDNYGRSSWERLGWAITGVIVLFSWSLANMVSIFYVLKRANLLRVPDSHLEEGLDLVEHGEHAWVFASVYKDTMRPGGSSQLASLGYATTPVLPQNTRNTQRGNVKMLDRNVKEASV